MFWSVEKYVVYLLWVELNITCYTWGMSWIDCRIQVWHFLVIHEYVYISNELRLYIGHNKIIFIPWDMTVTIIQTEHEQPAICNLHNEYNYSMHLIPTFISQWMWYLLLFYSYCTLQWECHNNCINNNYSIQWRKKKNHIGDKRKYNSTFAGNIFLSNNNLSTEM